LCNAPRSLILKVVRHFIHVFAALCLLAAVIFPASCGEANQTMPAGNRAAIIDQLYLREPNPAFIAQAKQELQNYGFTVDVWQGAAITVDFYRKLPSMGYKFIVLRVHSGMLVSMVNGKEVETKNTYLFTSENYTTTKYAGDQLTDKVSNAMMEENYPLVFAVNSQFIKAAKGKFDKTVILAMGCESYRYDDLPKAFTEKGAGAYIGWTDVVSLDYVDQVTLDLLDNLCTDNMTLAQAISTTTKDKGKDPYFNSNMEYYPSLNGGQTVSEIIR
jgi:hypothetical protein